MNEQKHSLSLGIIERNTVNMCETPAFPKKMKLEVTNLCNHKCIFCVQNRLNEPRGIIDRKFSEHILNSAYSFGVREVGFFIHGEPFCCPDLAWHISIAKQIGYEYVYLTTNGVLATPDKIREVVDAGLDSIKFSINAGSPESYLFIHGKDDFSQTLSNLKYAASYRKDANLPYKIYLSSIITSRIQNEIETIRMVFGKYVDDLTFLKARGCGGLMLENNSLIGGFTSVNECSVLFNTIHINYDGTLFACDNDANNSFQIANLLETDLFEAWYGAKMLELRKGIMNGNLNKKCEACLACGGSFVHIVKH